MILFLTNCEVADMYSQGHTTVASELTEYLAAMY